MKYILLALLGTINPGVVFALSPIEQEYNFELRNKSTATIVAQIHVSSNSVRYSYSVRNLPTSERPIISFNLELGVPAGDFQSLSPDGWDFTGCCVSDDADRGGTGMKAIGWLYHDESAQIQPGATQSGFQLSVSTFTVPEIRKFFIESFTTKPTPDCQETCGDEEEDRRIAQITDFFNNSTSGFTIGPGPNPSDVDLATLIDKLIALKHRSSSLGWLGDAKFVAKLDKRLDEAKAALARDRKKLARVRLTQFVHELEKAHKEHGRHRDDDHHGKDKGKRRDKKFANDEAFQLLKINAEFIIAKLPTKGKDKDEEDECRRAEGEKDDGGRDERGKKSDDRKGGKEHDR